MNSLQARVSNSIKGSISETVPHSPTIIAANIKCFGNQNEDTNTSADKNVSKSNDGEGLNSEVLNTLLKDLLQFIPNNELAQLAFHELTVKMQDDQLDPHHALYIAVGGKGFLND